MSDLETLKTLFDKRNISYTVENLTDSILLCVDDVRSGNVISYYFDRLGELETVLSSV
jgi:hypothetical protein